MHSPPSILEQLAMEESERMGGDNPSPLGDYSPFLLTSFTEVLVGQMSG